MTRKHAAQPSGEISGGTLNAEPAHRLEAVPWHAWAAEFAGTFFMVAWGLSAVVFMMSASSPMQSLMPVYRVRLLLTGILFAAGGTLVVYSPLGERSGGHINPAVSLTFWILGKMGRRDMALYAIAQFLGGLAGAALVKFLWRGWATSVYAGVTMPAPWISPAGAAGVEFLITGSLLWVILLFVSHPKWHRWTGFAAGVWIAFLVFAEAPVTGTSLNPARSLGPAIVTDTYRDLWVYFVGPLGGATAVALLWKPTSTSGVRSVFCAKLFHTDRYRCHLPDCHFAERHPSADGASRKEDSP
ncbi:MAG TPA: aquaporin [Candidatus Deferrimicrobium sp.]|nr:aquaporin [Candidatus Deferrimicrobium sp.]